MESIVYHSKDDFGYAFVQFDNPESATKVIAKYKHYIGGITVKAKAAHYHHQSRPRFKVSTADSPCNILDKLNEHCLMEIFEYLSVPDLCAVGNVCSDFRAVAKKVFSIQCPIVRTNFTRNWSLFRLFGPEIKTIQVNFRFNDEVVDNRILDLMATYCSEPSCALNKITISNWKIKGEFVERLKLIFSRIQVLEVFDAPNNGTVAQLLSNCNELIDLRLTGVDFGGISKIVFPKLETMYIAMTPGLNDYMINRFSESHPHLKELTIDSWTGKLTPKAFRNLGLNLRKVHLIGVIDISTTYVDSMLKHLKRLKNLKSLGLNCLSLSADTVFNVLIEEDLPVEELHLTDFNFDSTFLSGIKSMKHLKMINFSDVEWDDENLLMEMVKAHPQLQSISLHSIGDVTVNLIKELVKLAPKLEHMELDVTDYESIDSDDFTSIVKSIKSRLNKTKLKIELYCHGFELNVPEIIKKKNCEWFEIEIHDNGWSIGTDTISDVYDFDYDSEFDYDSDDKYVYGQWPILFF